MPPSNPRTPPLPAGGLTFLAEVADAQLAAALAEGHTPTAVSLLRVRTTDDDVELGWRALADDHHPVEELVGTIVSPEFCAVGVAATGVARHLDEPDLPVRVRTVHLVGRDGAWASRWSPIDDDGGGSSSGGASSGVGDGIDRPIGRIDDVCRRALGLATPPPPDDTGELWSQRWLDAIVDTATSGLAGHRTLRWADVAVLHPALAALQGNPGGGVPSPEALAGMATQLACLRDWTALRRACAARTWTAAGVAPAVAAWLDDGAFARWVLGTFPDLGDLRAVVADLLPASTAGAVEATLVASGSVSA